MKSIHPKIRTARLLAGLRIADVSRATGIDESMLGKIERGERRLLVRDLVRIAKALDVPPAELIDDYPDQNAVKKAVRTEEERAA